MDVGSILEGIKNAFTFPLFTLNQTPITVSSIIMFFLVVWGFFVLSKVLRRYVGRWLLGRFQMEQATRFTILKVTHYALVIIGSVFAFQFIGIDLSGLAVIFGLLSVGIGFGLQNLTSNFISGLILLFERPIRVGDRITVGDTEGNVTEINLRSTTVRSLNNISIIVPNSDFIASTVINWSHGDPKIRLDIDVGVSYDSDLPTVLRSLEEVAEESPDVLKRPKPEVYLLRFGDSSWDMRLMAWIGDPKQFRRIRSRLNCAIVDKFRANGVEIPYPQRDLHVRSPLPIPVGGETGNA